MSSMKSALAISWIFHGAHRALERAISALTIILMTTLVGPPVHAQRNVTVRFLDFKSGAPIGKLNVTITVFNDYGPRTSIAEKSIVFRTSTKTDKNGRVSVPLPSALPNHIRIWSDLAESVPDISPADVLKSGVLMPYQHEKGVSKVQVSANPGEIVILNTRVTAWDRMRQETP
jgi:hypothetical protein